MLLNIPSLIPRPRPASRRLQDMYSQAGEDSQAGEGRKFYHVSDIGVERLIEMKVGVQGLRKAKVPDNTPHISSHTYRALNV